MGLFANIRSSGQFEGLHVDRTEALGYLGYKPEEIDEVARRSFEPLALACEATQRASYLYSTFEVAHADERGVLLAGCDLLLGGRDLAAHVAGARALTLMAVTLGAASDEEMARRQAKAAAEGLLFNVACSALTEAAAHACEALIVERASAAGLFTTPWRFSPGYGDLPLSVQPGFVRALGAEAIGIRACENNFLAPIKSVTAVVGLFEEPPASGPRPTCELCQIQESCRLRARGLCCHK